MFRTLGRLFRAWEWYNFIRYFSPMGYAVDKLMEYIFNRMRLVDWVYVGAAGLLLLLWGVELVNWLAQAVLAILRATGAWHGVWPAWPALAKFAHPAPGTIIEWLLSGLFLLWAALSWLVYFARRLWPAEQLATVRKRMAEWWDRQASPSHSAVDPAPFPRP
ncbi:MAG: hypothetical protein IRZ33_11290, partial [Alicyclobacillaceae bacterium]|nr:hypothetical protein [Alicyclobacillaceae bacterium]